MPDRGRAAYLQRLAEQGLPVFIDEPVLCEQCNYNLQGLPMGGRCPRCGVEYCARPGWRRNVFIPRPVEWPIRVISRAVLLTFAGGTLLMLLFVMCVLGAVKSRPDDVYADYALPYFFVVAAIVGAIILATLLEALVKTARGVIEWYRNERYYRLLAAHQRQKEAARAAGGSPQPARPPALDAGWRERHGLDLVGRIDHPIVCESCCENLWHRPVVGRCPRCGRNYNAKPGMTMGVVEPAAETFPAGLLAGWVFAALVFAMMLLRLFGAFSPTLLASCMLFGGLAVGYGRLVLKRIRRYRRCQRLIMEAAGA